jgi:large subunit ribosomal protein L21
MTTAVIKTGGKQYVTHEGDTLKIEKLAGEEGEKITFSDVLMVADDAAKTVQVGMPTVAGASVEGTIIEQGRSKKVTVIKYKPKIRYRKKLGHRQHFTKVKVDKISA